jgi:hypothetical protein
MFLPLSLPAWRHNEVVPKEKLAHAAVHDGVVASLATAFTAVRHLFEVSNLR